MVAFGDHQKNSHFVFTGRPKKKKTGRQVGDNLGYWDERTKMAESMHMEMGEIEKSRWYEISLARGEDKVRYRRID